MFCSLNQNIKGEVCLVHHPLMMKMLKMMMTRITVMTLTAMEVRIMTLCKN